jgi:hypothetical protein
MNAQRQTSDMQQRPTTHAPVLAPSDDRELIAAILRYINWGLANGQPPRIELAELKPLFAYYYELAGEYPSPEIFGSFLAASASEKTKAQQNSDNQINQANQLVMSRMLLPTQKIEAQPGGDHDQPGGTPITVVAPLPRAERRRAPKTGYDYANSEYGAAAQNILAARPKLARYIAPACERVLSVLLAWRSHPLFLRMNGREGRYTSLGLDRLAREAGLTTKTVKDAIKALQAAQLIETTLAGLELGTEQRVPVPADELLVLKADCQLLTVEQGGGSHGYLNARCWQPNQQKSTSRATSNVFYVLKKDVWNDPVVRALGEFNPFAVAKSFSSTGKNAQQPFQSEKDFEKRTLAVVPTVTNERKGLEKDVAARVKPMKNTRKGLGKSSSAQKRTWERLKRTSRPIPTSFQRTHDMNGFGLNECIKEPSIKPKSGLEQGQEQHEVQQQPQQPKSPEQSVASSTTKRKNYYGQLNPTERITCGLLLNAHTKFVGLQATKGRETIEPIAEVSAIKFAQDYLPLTVTHVIAQTVQMAIEIDRRNPIKNPVGLLLKELQKVEPDAGRAQDVDGEGTQAHNLNRLPSKTELAALLQEAEAYYQENVATPTQARRLGEPVVSEAEGTNGDIRIGTGTGRRVLGGNGASAPGTGSRQSSSYGTAKGSRASTASAATGGSSETPDYSKYRGLRGRDLPPGFLTIISRPNAAAAPAVPSDDQISTDAGGSNGQSQPE